MSQWTSGFPAELGIITRTASGLVAGSMPGSSLQVSGTGPLQILFDLRTLGTLFQAISPSVVQGMLAEIGLVLILGQLYPWFGHGARPRPRQARPCGVMAGPALSVGLAACRM
ncbi:hypothetical protein [Amycolatopsis tucumanensis]|uniref:Uncharacterized protein n=1 Tax=Amycolatopsis tucumanensis TaxID=401106 RepID=A0ABP7JW23_9PSEU|nr:hypothetical protein [Amycolatopsis tucumanensis]MCF6429179.1 hypothetical protein [Amycolatopsis tucumanensis]